MIVDVAICGGGPVGLCLAYLLQTRGLTVRVFEAEENLSRDLRASTFHPPTLDMLAPTGIAGELVAQGLVCPSWQIRLHPTGAHALFDMSVLAGDTDHPYRLQCEQWKLSEILLRRLAPNTVSFGATLTGFAQDADGVALELDAKSGPARLRARYLVGCDGARSAVRKALDLAFDGQTYPETTLLATTPFPFDAHLPDLSNVTYCWKDGGNFSLLKVPGRWRVSLYPREDLPIEDQLADDAIEASLQEIVPQKTRYTVLEKRPYRVHQRIVQRYNVGRVALAGDAAHLNSPAGGMGLNGGLHDAFALTDALDDMLRNKAGLERLERYDRQRRPVAAEQILAQADRNRARMRERDPAKRREILADLQAICADRARLRTHLLKSSMIEGLRQAARVT